MRCDRITFAYLWMVLMAVIGFLAYRHIQSGIDARMLEAGSKVVYTATYDGCQRGNKRTAGTVLGLVLVDNSPRTTGDKGYLDPALKLLGQNDCEKEARDSQAQFRRLAP